MASDTVFPLRVVVSLTGLSARQIRYYEQRGLIRPRRSGGKQRLFGVDDIDRLKEVKRLLAQGMTLVGVAERLAQPHTVAQGAETDEGTIEEDRTDLTSLYPVSNRALLERYMDEKRGED